MDGYETCRRLKAGDDTRAIPVVLVTALHDPAARQRGLEAGADDFLTKPVDRGEVLARVRSLARLKRLYDEVTRSRDEVRALNEELEHRVRERTKQWKTTLEDLRAQIHERRQAEAAVLEYNARLQEALNELRTTQEQVIQQERLRALGEMASGIAHDFNNALAPVVGFSELLLARPENLQDPQLAQQYLQLIHTGARDAASVVARLREFYRQRETNEVFGAVELAALIEQVVSLTQPKWKNQAQAEGRTVQIQLELGEAPPVVGNETELREVLTNLIFNAVDAMPQGGTITLRTRADGDSVLLEVADTGTGMPEEVRQRCFEPFFSTKGARGTGLGLAMVHGTIERHGGRIEISSALGSGTTFRIRLPRGDFQASSSSAPHGHPLLSLRVLVVDDDAGVRAVTVAYLQSEGHQVEAAGNGQEALQVIEHSAIDLVITDRAMPGMSGDQLAVAVKRLHPHLPIVLLTGFGDLMAATGDIPPGVDCVIGKPVTLETLRRTIATVTGHQPDRVSEGDQAHGADGAYEPDGMHVGSAALVALRNDHAIRGTELA
jgi:signal transduction histidine kinase